MSGKATESNVDTTDSPARPTLSRPVTTGDLIKVKKLIRMKECKDLGRCLKLDEMEIDQIKKQFESDGEDEVAYKMMYKWMEKEKANATLQLLIHGLQSIGRDDAADQLLGTGGHPSAAAPSQHGQVFSNIASGDTGKYSAVNVGSGSQRIKPRK